MVRKSGGFRKDHAQAKRYGQSWIQLSGIGLFYKLAKLDWHAAYQVAMSICYIVLSVRLIQLILAFRGE
jgi:hypothetical protein